MSISSLNAHKAVAASLNGEARKLADDLLWEDMREMIVDLANFAAAAVQTLATVTGKSPEEFLANVVDAAMQDAE